jgi:hypothetical protein
MKVPQFSFRLKIVQEATDSPQRIKRSIYNENNNKILIQSDEDNKEWIVVDDSLLSTRNETYVSVIIDDLNDETPVFDVGSNLIVAYPLPSLAIELLPPYLTVVKVRLPISHSYVMKIILVALGYG